MRTSLILALLALAPVFAAADPLWQSDVYLATVDPAPRGWETISRDAAGFALAKNLETEVYAYTERLTFKVSRSSVREVDALVESLSARGFHLFGRDRVLNGDVSIPVWQLFGKSGEQEGRMIQIVLHSGFCYIVDLRYMPDDKNAPGEASDLLDRLRFLPDERERAWSLLTAGKPRDAEPLFARLLRSNELDANALYGMGLAKLADGRPREAIPILEKAGPLLGQSEDVRRALGRAQLDDGRPVEAAVTWIGFLRDNPRWEEELRPLIAKAAIAADPGLSAPTPRDQVALRNELVGIATVMLARFHEGALIIRGGGQWRVPAEQLGEARQRFSDDLEALLAKVRAAPQVPQDVQALLSFWQIERAIGVEALGIQKNDLAKIERGHLMITAALNGLRLRASAQEEER